MKVTLSIENVYDDGSIWTTVETEIEEPPLPYVTETGVTHDHEPAGFLTEEEEEARSEWEWDVIAQYTGTGREEGEAAYFVEVIESSDQDLLPVGTKFEFGL